MTGDERTRFCSLCSLHVYNFSEMTTEEVRGLVTRTEGRVCGRLYRRADGTVITRDCPVGLRAVRRRVARTAGATLAAIISLFAAVGGQTKQKDQSKQDEKVCKIVRGLAVERKPSQAAGSLAVTVVDPAGAVIANADVTLTNERTGEKFMQTMTADESAIKFTVASADDYTVTVSASNFKTVKARHVRLNTSEAANVQIAMPLSSDAMEMGIIVMDDSSFGGPGGGVTTFNSKQITSLPIR